MVATIPMYRQRCAELKTSLVFALMPFMLCLKSELVLDCRLLTVLLVQSVFNPCLGNISYLLSTDVRQTEAVSICAISVPSNLSGMTFRINAAFSRIQAVWVSNLNKTCSGIIFGDC